MRRLLNTFYWASFLGFLACQQPEQQPLVIDETGNRESIENIIAIDSVWSGHPVGFCLLTNDDTQYIAYYNANRNMVVGQRKLNDADFSLYVMPETHRDTHHGTSTVLGWDSHNYVTIGIDKENFIHVSGNVHAHPLTYFRSSVPGDISTLEQHYSMTGEDEDRTTYPKFLKSREGDLIYTYRDGGSGNGNQIYNIYDCHEKTWTRLLDRPLTDGQGQMNAYISSPELREDDWYHTYWVWRDTPDCATNHDLSYMKSPDLIHWYTAFEEPIVLPATIEKTSAVVDPIPPGGGIINLAAKMVLDQNGEPAFVYHKYDSAGNLQLYTARTGNNQWVYTRITDWDYRWEFKGRGSINSEVLVKSLNKRTDGLFEVDFWHIKYGNGTILLNDRFENIGTVLRPEPFGSNLEPEGKFPGLTIRTSPDIGNSGKNDIRYVLKWETLDRNRDRPREGALPEASILYLYELNVERRTPNNEYQ